MKCNIRQCYSHLVLRQLSVLEFQFEIHSKVVYTFNNEFLQLKFLPFWR